MKRTNILAMFVLALVLMVCLSQVGRAAPMGSAFRYQGDLWYQGNPANALYDFEFRLYNDLDAGEQLAGTIGVNDVNVTDGFFGLDLDFGSGVFDGNALWLEISVRPDDPCDFVKLSPRQELMPTPYALYAASGTPGPQGEQGEQGLARPPRASWRFTLADEWFKYILQRRQCRHRNRDTQ